MPRRRHEIWAADCETDPFKVGRIPQPFIWGAYEIYTQRYETFGHARTFVDFFRDRESTVYFHNGGKFDLHYLRPEFNSNEHILIISGRIARAHIGKAEFRDSFNLMPVPLREYQKDDFDYSILESDVRDRPENRAKIEAYLKSDCVNLGNMLLDYFSRFGRGLTQAGAAMNYWSKHFNGGRKPRQTASQFERYKPYYYGGRVECFAVGYQKIRFKVADKNSAYPDAMYRAQHPISCEAMLLSGLPKKREQIQQCFITLRAVAQGAFPYRLDSGELCFPRDETPRTFHVTGWEYLAAQDEKALADVEIQEVHFFRETVSFKEYIDYFYQQRQIAKANGDKAGDLFNKLFMNGCYGGFAMNPENYHEYMLSSEDKLSEHIEDGFQIYHPWGDGRQLLWRKLPLETQKRMYKNIATAASITGYVRAELFRDLRRVEGPLYCDTDSIAALSIDGLRIGKELGQWKEVATCEWYAIAGKKLYVMHSENGEDLMACKGVKLTADEIKAIAQGARVAYHPAVPTYSISRSQPRFISREVRATAVH